ncbi:hypothetical protein [Cupriavidus sp. USMAA2-4]|uniref:hypothetical protein n=1 Tax=Cupriavidus sp. USMAA2-4 TaxID=876364 RepID=UPI0012F492FE|nr:hypothetical protein [Cupriavidus sp. USMAA2-4]
MAIEDSNTFIPNFTYPFTSFLDKISATGQENRSAPNDEVLLLAISCYTHAVRSTQWVWGFLLAVMTLEMLATQTPTSDSTRAAAQRLAEFAKLEYENVASVNLARIKACVNEAKRISKKTALKELVRGRLRKRKIKHAKA